MPKTVPIYVSCPNCHKSFSRFDPTRVILDVNLDGLPPSEYIYCSRTCMDAIVDNINRNPYEIQIVIEKMCPISENPQKWVLECKTDLKVFIL
jgi:hypothetical protein